MIKINENNIENNIMKTNEMKARMKIIMNRRANIRKRQRIKNMPVLIKKI